LYFFDRLVGQERREIMGVTKEQRVGIVISVVWGVFTLAWSLDTHNISTFLLLGLMPLLIGWGIWWIKWGKPKQDAGDKNGS
jgi:hypothetical protein